MPPPPPDFDTPRAVLATRLLPKEHQKWLGAIIVATELGKIGDAVEALLLAQKTEKPEHWAQAEEQARRLVNNASWQTLMQLYFMSGAGK